MAMASTGTRTASLLIVALTVSAALAAQDAGDGGRRGGGPGAFVMMQMSPILAVVDVDHDGRISPDELAGAPARLRTLDKNGDGMLTRDEAGMTLAFGGRGRGPGRGGEDDVPPIPGPTADELLATLLSYDKNGDGRLERSEVPERLQGMFDRGDTDKNGVLDAAELRKLAADQAAPNPGDSPERRGGGPGREGPGRGGPGGFDVAFTALDADHDGQISGDEIAHASASLKTLDRNGDGWITEDEVRPSPDGRGN